MFFGHGIGDLLVHGHTLGQQAQHGVVQLAKVGEVGRDLLVEAADDIAGVVKVHCQGSLKGGVGALVSIYKIQCMPNDIFLDACTQLRICTHR